MKTIVTKHLINAVPTASDFDLKQGVMPQCPADGVILRVVYLSLEPYIGSVLRGRHFSHKVPTPLEDAPPASAVCEVIESRCAQLTEGTWVYAPNAAWSEYIAHASEGLMVISPSIAPLSCYAGAMGIPGLTAWASATRLAKIREGDHVLVNAAAGPVGGIFGQLAKAQGASRVIGVAGGPTKCELVVNKYGFDGCIDYKVEGWEDELKLAFPDGLSVFHENVSAEMAMKALAIAKPYARGVLCGLANAYQSEKQQTHPLNAGMIIMKRAQLSGLVVYDFLKDWEQFTLEMSNSLQAGDIQIHEDRVEGLEKAPMLFEKLMKGENIGKTLVVVAKE